MNVDLAPHEINIIVNCLHGLKARAKGYIPTNDAQREAAAKVDALEEKMKRAQSLVGANPFAAKN